MRSPLHDDTQIMRNIEPIKYKLTRFDQYLAPFGETPGSARGRHIAEIINKIEAVELPHGVQLQCSLPGCTDPPPLLSKKDGDERLRMLAAPLAKDPNPPTPPDIGGVHRADGPGLTAAC